MCRASPLCSLRQDAVQLSLSEVCLHYRLPLLTLAACSSLCKTIFSWIYLIYLIFIPSVRKNGHSANRSAQQCCRLRGSHDLPAGLRHCVLFAWCCSCALTRVPPLPHAFASSLKGLFQGELTESHAYCIAECGLSGLSFSI